VAVPAAAILSLAILALTMMGWMERHLACPLIAGILDSVPGTL
jgi:hypothetical protein